MEKMNLTESRVVFNQEHHTYTLDGRELSGVTPIVAWLFPNTYKGIPQSVLENAAAYGTMIHEKCELADSMGIVDDDIVKAYCELMKKNSMKVHCSEYLVSDEESIASCIDKVFEDDSLGDIKTTSKVHTLNVQVQLSIYAYLYELQTGRKANKLYLIWLPKAQYGQPEVRELERICEDWCQEAIERFVAGDSPAQSLAELAAMGYVGNVEEKQRKEGEVPERWEETINELIMIKKQLDILTEREKEIKASIMATMQQMGDDKWSSDLIQISRRAASERVIIDTKALQQSEPDIYERFKKVTKVAEILTYKVL